ncbi:MAG: glycosyltransferase family 39 protein [Rudaea sp.]
MTDNPPPSVSHPRREWLLFMLLALVLLGAGIGMRDPWPSDEPRFTLAAQEMVQSGDWLFPHRGSELYADKPPMLMWAEAISYEVTGNWRVAFLLPSLLAALATLWLTYDLGRRLWNHRAGLYAATTMLFAVQFMYQMKRAQIDPLVTAWITLANWGLLLHFLRGPNWRMYWLGCFAAGLGVITKGVGFLALLMFLPYVFARVRGWEGVTRTQHSAARWAGGALAFLLPILVWGISVLLVAKSRGTPEYAAYVRDLFLHQTAGRYAGSWSHPQPFWYFLPIILFGWFPLSLMYFGAVPRWRFAMQAGEARVVLPLVWALLVVIFFSIATGKRDVYILPALPMVALAMAPFLEEILQARWLRTTAFSIACVGGIAIAVVGFWALLGHLPQADDFVQRRALANAALSVWSMVIAIGATLVLSALIYGPRRGWTALLWGFCGVWLIWSLWAYPLLNDSSSARGIMHKARETAGPRATIGLVAWKEQNLLMAAGPTTEFGFTKPWAQQYSAAVAWQAKAPDQRWIFALSQAMGQCVDRDKAQRIGEANRREWWMFRSDAVIPGCVPTGDANEKQSVDDE